MVEKKDLYFPSPTLSKIPNGFYKNPDIIICTNISAGSWKYSPQKSHTTYANRRQTPNFSIRYSFAFIDSKSEKKASIDIVNCRRGASVRTMAVIISLPSPLTLSRRFKTTTPQQQTISQEQAALTPHCRLLARIILSAPPINAF